MRSNEINPNMTQEQIVRDNLIGRISQALCGKLHLVTSEAYMADNLKLALDMLEDEKMGDVYFFGGRKLASAYFLGLLRLLVLQLQDEVEKRIDEILKATCISDELWEEADFPLWYKSYFSGMKPINNEED